MTDGLNDVHREAIIAKIAANSRVERAVLFGSRATGTNTVSSDVDIALFGDRLTLTDQARLAAALDEIPMAQSVDLLLYNSIQDRTLREHIRNQGIELFARSSHQRTKWDTSSTTTGWLETRLGDVVRLLSGGTPSKKRKAYWNGTTPWVSAKDMKLFRIRDTTHHVTAEGLANGTKLVPAGTILLLTRGMTLLKDVPVCVAERPMAFNQDVKALLPKARVDPSFLSYLILGNKQRLQNLVDLAGHGTGRINSDELRALDVRLPPTGEQQAIAHVLGTLDDKIELNRRMNETLEAMARALFKSWFVDFDPVRAKMEGRDTGLPQDIANLFPDRLVDSEIGEIPEAWEVASLGDVAASRRRGVDPASVASDTPYIGLADMPRGSIALTDWGGAGSVSSTKSAFKAGDILFGKLRPYFHKVGIAPMDGLCSTDIVVLGERKPIWSAFVVACVSSTAFVVYTSQTATGTRMPRTSWQTMSRYELGRPTNDVASQFERLVAPILRRIVENVHESRTLAALRDTLLPKLISGELRTGDAETLVSSVSRDGS